MKNKCPYCDNELKVTFYKKGKYGTQKLVQKTCGSDECRSKLRSDISREYLKNRRSKHPWKC